MEQALYVFTVGVILFITVVTLRIITSVKKMEDTFHDLHDFRGDDDE